MADTRRISPLAHRTPIAVPDGAAAMGERPHLGRLILRAEAQAAAPAVKKVTGAELPAEPNTSSSSKGAHVLWLGPDEWMLVAEPGGEDTLHARLSKALGGTHHQLVDVSDQYTAIELTGARARDMLMKLTTLDLHPKYFVTGDTAGSLFGRATATLVMTGGGEKVPPRFELIVRRSFADYLWCLLAEAGREFGLPAQEPRAGETMRR